MRNCLVCGVELDPEWTRCGECDTPIPEPGRPVMVEIPNAAPGDTHRAAVWSAVLVVLGFCLPFVPIAAVPVGMSAIRDIDESEGRMGGRALAKVSVVAGAIFGAVHVIVFLLAMIPIAFGGPNMLVGVTGGGEDMGLGSLKKLYEAESMARFSVAVDNDKDGLGEFVKIERLGGGHLPYLRSDLADGAVGGYWLMVVLPDDPNAREKQWWGIAQPQFKRRGWRTFVVDASGVIRAKDTGGADPDLADLDAWESIDMVVSRYDEEVLAAQAEVERRQMQQTHGMLYAEQQGRF